MGIEVKDVPRWCTVHGISHAVANAHGNWVSMACNTLIIGGDYDETVPGRRICRKCRAALKRVTLAKDLRNNDPERWEAIREEREEVEQEVQP